MPIPLLKKTGSTWLRFDVFTGNNQQQRNFMFWMDK
jgi:hypothetical protein